MQLELFERWKPILDNCYFISTHGRIRSAERIVERHGFHSNYLKEGKMMSDFNNGNGYRYVTTSINGFRRNHYMHKLVAEAFIPNPNNYEEVNHINGIKTDNQVSNLEWCSRSHNIKHAYDSGLNMKGGNKTNARKVIHIRDNKVFECIRHASDFYGIKYGLLKEALKRNSKTARNEHYKNLVFLENYIEENPFWSREQGYSLSRLEQ